MQWLELHANAPHHASWTCTSASAAMRGTQARPWRESLRRPSAAPASLRVATAARPSASTAPSSSSAARRPASAESAARISGCSARSCPEPSAPRTMHCSHAGTQWLRHLPRAARPSCRVVHVSDAKGYGMIAVEAISAGALVAEYIGAPLRCLWRAGSSISSFVLNVERLAWRYGMRCLACWAGSSQHSKE